MSPSAKAALNRLGDIFNIKLSNEIDAEKAIGRMATRSLEIEQHLAALARMHVRAMACRFWGLLDTRHG